MKKGIMFSFIIFLFASILTSLILIHRSMIVHKRELLAIQTRVVTMNNFFDSISRDLGKASEIIVRRAVSASISRIISSGIPLDDAIYRLKELSLNGTINGTDEVLMENATLPEWVDKIEIVGLQKGFQTNISITNFELEPYDSWNLIAKINFSIEIADLKGIANLSRNASVEKLISIEGLEDPLYPLYTQGYATNTIVRTPFKGNFTMLLVEGIGNGRDWVYGESILIDSVHADDADDVQDKDEKILVTDNASVFDIATLNDFKGLVTEGNIPLGLTIPSIINATNAMNLIPNNTNILLDSNLNFGDAGKVWFIENLKEHVENSYYHESSEGPSFLDRLEGRLTCNYCNLVPNIGLESFVNKQYFNVIGLSIEVEKTNVDYIYFNNTRDPSSNGVKGLDSTFRIDNEPLLGTFRRNVYNITSDLIIS